jgi:hypothetical protein
MPDTQTSHENSPFIRVDQPIEANQLNETYVDPRLPRTSLAFTQAFFARNGTLGVLASKPHWSAGVPPAKQNHEAGGTPALQ